jgi:aryl-alcohol dehydrogenase-like predicted oxidoreductase
MKLHTLGRTGIKVSPLCLGAMMFGEWGNPDHDDSIRIIHRALDSGINFIDTADVYSQGESEIIVGKALASLDRSRVVVATKVHGNMGDDPNAQGNSRRWIMAECENSLRRLGVDYIDLYQIHRPDQSTDYVPCRANRRSAVGRPTSRPRTLPDGAAALFNTRTRHREGRVAHCP